MLNNCISVNYKLKISIEANLHYLIRLYKALYTEYQFLKNLLIYNIIAIFKI